MIEKNKQQPGNYKPTISVSTKKINDKIEIKVKDNGNGISQKVVDKIFSHSLLQNQQAKEQAWN